jgi:hypothetical protein
MKRILFCLLIAILLLNVFGYYGIFLGLQYKNDRHLDALLDEDNYDRSDAITIRIPLSIPYMGETSYQRVSGAFEYRGEFYKLVKQKLSADTLFVVCVKNEVGKTITQALEQYVKTFTDKASDANQPAALTIPSFIKDFLPTEIAIESAVKGWASMVCFSSLELTFDSAEIALVSPPPQA